MKKEICLMCIICFLLGYFVADVISKCGFGREHMSEIQVGNPGGHESYQQERLPCAKDPTCRLHSLDGLKHGSRNIIQIN